MRSIILLTSMLFFACADNGNGTVASSPGTVPPSQPGSTPPPASPSDAEVPAAPETPNAGNITITRPADGTVIRQNPITVEGTARTFENNVVLQVHDEEGNQILQTATTARGDLGTFNPWSEELWLTEWPGERLTVRGVEHSAKDGSIRSLSTVTLENGLERREVTLFFPNMQRTPNDCSVVHPAKHIVPNSVGMARLLTEALIAGPSHFETTQGFSSQFPRGARINSIDLDGSTITIDFSPEMQNVGGSCRVQSIRASIEKTLTQLPNVSRVRITAGGSEDLALQP
ncbi:MAG TPA: Gmad2 immunoglobulin-like domain-containing protein [Thermoanaerobaculia bacterium]|nr:Gmad2 immunoglobulin-like domain-containing protein [Thermoanaerobaculia bacterium]